MPIVPRRVAPAPLPDAQVSGASPGAPPASAFGGGAGNVTAGIDLSPVAHEVQRIALEEKAKASEAILDSSRLQVGQFRQGLAAEYENLRGLDAPAQQEAYRQQWQQGVRTIREGLPSDELRAAFDHTTVADDLDFNERVVRHSYAQTQQADAQTYTGSRELLFNDITAHAGDDAAVTATLGRLNALTQDYGTRTGQPPEIIAAELARDRSNAHASVVDSLTAQGDLRAAPYLAAHADEMLGAQRIQAEKAVRVLTVRSESQQHSDQILFASPEFPALNDALAQVRAIGDPEVRDATEQRVRQAFAEKRAADHDERDDKMIKAANLLDASRGDVHSIPANDWSALEPSQRKTLNEYAVGIRNGDNITTDWHLYNDRLTEATTKATEQDFLRRNLTDDMSQLARPQLKELIDYQARLRSADATARDQARQDLGKVRTTQEIVTQGLHAVGIGIDAKKRAKDDPIINDVFESVQRQVGELADREKRKPTSAEVQGIVDDLLTSHVVSTPGFFGRKQTTKRPIEMGPDDQLVLSTKDIPAAQLPALDNWLRARGQAATDVNRVNAYSIYLNSLVRRGPR